jgi:hypothetical protein
MDHPLHKSVGDALRAAQLLRPDLDLVLDPACGGKQRIPLFLSKEGGRRNCLCCVDAILLDHNRKTISVIVEIEESSLEPTTICGKLMTSALSRGFMHQSTGGRLVPMGNPVLFLQILDTSSLKRGSAKIAQWRNIEERMNQLFNNDGITYRSLEGTPEAFSESGVQRAKLATLVGSGNHLP